MATRPIPPGVAGTTYRRHTPLGMTRVVGKTIDAKPFETF